MNLYTKVFISSMIPLIIVIAVSMIQINHFIDAQIQNSLKKEIDQKELITDRFSKKLQNIYKNITIISSSYEIVDAIKSNDNEILTIWSKNFLNLQTMIFFTDLNGIVLARAHDEFNFGDSLQKKDFFSNLEKFSSCHLITKIDNKLSYVIGKKIIQYEKDIGYLIFALKINKTLLNDLSRGTIFKLKINKKIDSYEKNKKLPFVIYQSQINEEIKNTLKLKHFLFYSLIFLVLFLSIIVFIIMKSHLKPYLKFTQILSDFSENKITLTRLRIKSKYFARLNRNHEIEKVANAVYEMSKQVQKDQKHLEKLSQVDQLTQVFNRRRIEDIFETIFYESKKFNGTFSIIIIDIDHFKKINDTFGHLFGDFVLKEVSKSLKKSIRETDFLGRYGGEEFLIITKNCTGEAASKLAEKLRTNISNIELDKVLVTASFGLVEFDKKFSNKDEMFNEADANLYEAKNSGRNKVIG